jgi:uncharacterized protein YdaU (DUF1376 family)
MLLILHYWMHGGLPADDRELARITKLTVSTWRKSRSTIEAFFHDGWRHKRIDQDIDKIEQVSERRQVAGSKGGTRAAIARQRGKQLPQGNSSNTSSKRAANEQQNSSKSVAKLQLEEEDITTNLSVAAREERDSSPTNSTPETAGLPDGFAEGARRAVQQNTGTSYLVEALTRKAR